MTLEADGEDARAIRRSASTTPGRRSTPWRPAVYDPKLPLAFRIAEVFEQPIEKIFLHLPMPVPQFEVFDARGRFVGRSDFGWEEEQTLGEFDGKQKYGELLLKTGQTQQDALFEEKQREDRLRDLGWQVVRWVWADLFQPAALADRLDRAFARGRRR